MARRSPVAFKSQIGELPVTGALTGDDLKIAFTLPIQGQSIDIVMTGKVEGPTLAGKVQFGDFGEGDWTATRAEAAPTGPQPRPRHPRRGEACRGSWRRERRMGFDLQDAERRCAGHRDDQPRRWKVERHTEQPDGRGACSRARSKAHR